MAMVEISEIGVKEEELELDLGLSIGGSFRKSETTSKPVERESGLLSFDSKTINGVNLDLNEVLTTATTASRSSSSPAPKTKREIHALRRQEAKKKQREKRSRGLKNSSPSSQDQNANSTCLLVEEQRASKREKTEYGIVNVSQSNAEVNNNNNNNNGNMNSSNGQTLPYHPFTAAQYPYAPLQFVPYTNGFAYPCVTPCWTQPTTPGGTDEKNVFHPVPCRGFGPFLTGLGLSNGGQECEIRKTTSHRSPLSSSSTVLDHRGSSQEGDGSSDTRTHSSQSSREQNQRKDSKPNDNKAHSEVQSASSHHAEPAPTLQNSTTETNNVSKEKRQNSPPKSNDTLKETNMELGRKPPRPQAQNRNGTPPPQPIQQMPYVSTRGNGPNGKTVTGFLYRYTKSEVSIVCVCHGTTFSPAQFVEHAGGTDVSEPLKHITVIPSAFAG